MYALLRPEFPDRLTIGPIDLTGPARYHLPRSLFRLADRRMERRSLHRSQRVLLRRLGRDRRHRRQTARGRPRQIAAARGLRLPNRFQIDDPTQLVEIRLRLLTGAIEGSFACTGIELHRLANLDEAKSGWEARTAASIGVQ